MSQSFMPTISPTDVLIQSTKNSNNVITLDHTVIILTTTIGAVVVLVVALYYYYQRYYVSHEKKRSYIFDENGKIKIRYSEMSERESDEERISIAINPTHPRASGNTVAASSYDSEASKRSGLHLESISQSNQSAQRLSNPRIKSNLRLSNLSSTSNFSIPAIMEDEQPHDTQVIDWTPKDTPRQGSIFVMPKEILGEVIEPYSTREIRGKSRDNSKKLKDLELDAEERHRIESLREQPLTRESSREKLLEEREREREDMKTKHYILLGQSSVNVSTIQRMSTPRKSASIGYSSDRQGTSASTTPDSGPTPRI